MAKPTLYWIVKRRTYTAGYTVMRVTSEAERHLYGSEDGYPTHCRRSEVLGRHDTEEAARACIEASRSNGIGTRQYAGRQWASDFNSGF